MINRGTTAFSVCRLDEHTISAELDGFAKWTRDRIVARAGLNVDVPVVMKVGGVNESVQVSLDTPLIDTSTRIHAINIGGELQHAVPFSTLRLWTDYLLLMPGVIPSSSTNFTEFYVHGTTQNSHVFQVDGDDVTAASQNSNLHTNFSIDRGSLGGAQLQLSEFGAFMDGHSVVVYVLAAYGLSILVFYVLGIMRDQLRSPPMTWHFAGIGLRAEVLKHRVGQSRGTLKLLVRSAIVGVLVGLIVGHAKNVQDVWKLGASIGVVHFAVDQFLDWLYRK